MAKVSVILPAFNAGFYIEDSIYSVLSQSYKNLELIIVDDCSTDDTQNIVNTIANKDPRVRVHRKKRNSGGPAKPRNIGLEMANGDYVAFIDADDLWHTEKLLTQIKQMTDNKLDFCATKMFLFSLSDKPNKNIRLEENGSLSNITHSKLIRKNIIATSSVLLTAELATKLFFSELQHHIAIEDYLAWLRLHQNDEVISAVLDERLIFYRYHQNSLSSSKIKMAKKIYRLLHEYELKGHKLGLEKYFYFFTYIIGGIRASMLSAEC